jgi:hypothetical protein
MGIVEVVSVWFWISAGVVAYAAFMVFVVGMCRAAASADALERRLYRVWAQGARIPLRSHRPAA